MTVFFPLFYARVEGEETFLLERSAKRLAQGHQGSRDCMPQCTGLSGRSAAVHGCLDGKLAGDPGHLERELNDLAECERGKCGVWNLFDE